PPGSPPFPYTTLFRSRFIADASAQAGARAELARIEARLAELATGGDRGDEAEATRDGLVDMARHEETARLRAEWNDAYWRSFPEDRKSTRLNSSHVKI